MDENGKKVMIMYFNRAREAGGVEKWQVTKLQDGKGSNVTWSNKNVTWSNKNRKFVEIHDCLYFEKTWHIKENLNIYYSFIIQKLYFLNRYVHYPSFIPISLANQGFFVVFICCLEERASVQNS